MGDELKDGDATDDEPRAQQAGKTGKPALPARHHQEQREEDDRLKNTQTKRRQREMAISGNEGTEHSGKQEQERGPEEWRTAKCRQVHILRTIREQSVPTNYGDIQH